MNRLAIAVTFVTAAAGCKKSVDSADFEKRLTKRTEELGLTGAKVSCPKNIEAKAGATFECTVALGDKVYPLIATIKSADGDDLQMDTKWKAGDAVLSAKLDPALTAELSQQLGTPVVVVCGEPLRFLDATRNVTCDLTAGETKAKAIITFDDKLAPTDWKLDPPLLAKAKLEARLTPSVREKTAPGVTVDCGPTPLLERPADGKLFCTLAGGGEQARLAVEIDPELNIKGWEVVSGDAAPAAAPETP